MAIGGMDVTKMRREFEAAVDKPLVGGSPRSSSAAGERTREQEMALFMQAHGSM